MFESAKKKRITIADLYPELSPAEQTEAEWQERYFALLFGSIAAGLACAREIKKVNITL